MAISRPRGKGVTLIALSAIRLDELLDIYRESANMCVAGEKVLMFFFRQKTLKCALGGGV
jgi:hypothetical protein